MGLSDHNAIMVELSFVKNVFVKNKYKKANEWKLNEIVLEDKDVNEFILEKCKKINYLKEKYENNWYEYFINDIIKMLQKKSRILNEKRNEKINNLFTELNNLNGCSNKNANNNKKLLK